MAKYIEGREYSAPSTVDLTGKQGYAIALDTTNKGNVTLANAQTLPIIGILAPQGEVVANDTAGVFLGQVGTARAIMGGTVHVGDNLTADSSGKLITTTTAADQVIAIALEEGLTGEYHQVLLCNKYYHA